MKAIEAVSNPSTATTQKQSNSTLICILDTFWASMKLCTLISRCDVMGGAATVRRAETRRTRMRDC